MEFMTAGFSAAWTRWRNSRRRSTRRRKRPRSSSMRCADRQLLAAAAMLLLSGCASFGPGGQTSTSSSPAQATASVTAPGKSATAPAPARPAATPEEQFQDAVQKMQAHDYAGAEPVLVDLTKHYPALPGPYI